MSMTRKDFELIAEALNEVMQTNWNENDRQRAEYFIGRAADALAVKLRSTNPRFDKARFLAACGVTPA